MVFFFCLSGFLWCLQVKLPPTVHLLQDKGKLMDLLLRRRDCKMVILSVCAQSASMATKRELTVMRHDRAELELLFFPVLEGDKGRLPVVATVFDKLNQVYKEYLEAEQSYAAVSEPQWVCVRFCF